MTITPDQITLGMQVACVERELALRHQVYPRMVGQAKMKQATADLQNRRDGSRARDAEGFATSMKSPDRDAADELRKVQTTIERLKALNDEMERMALAQASELAAWRAWGEALERLYREEGGNFMFCGHWSSDLDPPCECGALKGCERAAALSPPTRKE